MPSSQSSPLINKNITKQETHHFLFTSMVSHRGTPISFAMRDDGQIFYSVLSLSTSTSNASLGGGDDRDNDKNYWSKVSFDGAGTSRLHFPNELVQIGYGVVPNYQVPKYSSARGKVIHSYDDKGQPLDANGHKLSVQDIKSRTNPLYSSTARLGAKAPFQVLSDAKYVYVFRQSIPAEHPNNADPAVVNSTLLVDRFILSGTVLKLSREIRYQRSRHKTEPESRKDTLAPVDVEGNPFYEPTRELVFANNLPVPQGGGEAKASFSVLLLPGADAEEQRWQIFTADAQTHKINSFNIRFDYSLVFDTSDSQVIIDEFIEEYQLDTGLIAEVQAKIAEHKTDATIVDELAESSSFDYNNLDEGAKGTLKDALGEVTYTIRTGVSKDDFVMESSSEWPLMEYEADGSSIKSEYLENGALALEYTFQGPRDELRPYASPYLPRYGLSSCYYYQQEMGPDGKPMKNKACVMLVMGLEDRSKNRYLGLLNFSAAASGRLSRLTSDALDMPDINVQALDENPYRDLNSLNEVSWQEPQRMRLLDIDNNGLSTSGGVLKFAYTSAAIGESQGYSDAVAATDPYVFDDSLGRVNLYFKGKNNNFFVLYFNPSGSKSLEVTHRETGEPVSPALALKPRLDEDITLHIKATFPDNPFFSHTCTLSVSLPDTGEEVENWNYLPRRVAQVSSILNGDGALPLGTLEPLGKADDPRAAYVKPTSGPGKIILRTTKDNDLMFQGTTWPGNSASDGDIAGGKSKKMSLGALSIYLVNNSTISIAKHTFSLTGEAVVKADLFHKSYLAGIVDHEEDISQLWKCLQDEKLIEESDKAGQAHLMIPVLINSSAGISSSLSDEVIDKYDLKLLQEGNTADLKARRARLRLSLVELLTDIAAVRLVELQVVDTNTEYIDRLEAGLSAKVRYNYAENFSCKPEKLSPGKASEWEHPRSYLFNSEVFYDDTTDASTPINRSFDYQYEIHNAIGQWEDWEASLALEFNPSSGSDGAALTLEQADKLEVLKPTEKGLSVEAWVKPDKLLSSAPCILNYKKGQHHYSLGLLKLSNGYKCVATLGGQKYVTKNIFSAQDQQWRHVAFSHKKYWGYQLSRNEWINCGNDSSLQLEDEFTIEVLVKIDTEGNLLEKKGEYSLFVNANREVVFKWGDFPYLTHKLEGSDSPQTGQADILKQFYKITLIRSRKKPQTNPTKEEYPITGGIPTDQAIDTDSKWYEDKSSDEILKGMAEKQDQLEAKMKSTQRDMFGGGISDSLSAMEDPYPTYFHTLIITKNDNSSIEFITPDAREVETVEAYEDLTLGGNGFAGTFASVRLWNRALAADEAKTLAVADNKSGLLSHWRMTEGEGSYLYDNVSENHGVATGGFWTDSPQSNQRGQFQFYIDGSPEDHIATMADAAPAVEQFCVGAIKTATGFDHHFDGTLEEIRIWNLPRTNEQITDNAFGRLKGEWEQLLANYTFDKPIKQTGGLVQDASINSAQLQIYNQSLVKEVLSTAPIASEIPQVRSALTGVLTAYNGYISTRPCVAEYGDVQKNDDGTLNGILKRCYSFIDEQGAWNRMTGYKVGNLISQWYSQAQFAPQVMGYLEGPPPVPAENLPIAKDADVDTYAYILDNSVSFHQAEEVSYNYSTSKENGWNAAVESEGYLGLDLDVILAPLGVGFSIEAKGGVASKSHWDTSGTRSGSYERGTSVNSERAFSAALAGYDNGKSGAERFYKLGNTGYALVKSKTADIYLLRLAHNNALVSIFWQPNPDIPEDINIIPFPLNPTYVKQGTLDGKFGDTTDDHYPQAHGAYGQYSYFKPREAYKLKKRIEREKMELKAYFEDSFDPAKANAHFIAAAAGTAVPQLAAFVPGAGPIATAGINQAIGQVATRIGYNNTDLKDDLARIGSQRNLVNTYVWTIEGGFYAESTEVAETQQETYANDFSLSIGGGLGIKVEGGAMAGLEQTTLLSSGSSFTLTKAKTKESSTSFGLDVSVDLPTSPRYKYAGNDGRSLTNKGLIGPGTVDAYRFMSFYLEPKGQNFTDLFAKVIDPIWLDESPDPNAQALRQARGNIAKAKPCWRIMHRVTYVSRVLPEFQPEAPPSLEKSLRIAGIESNYMLIKKFEPYVAKLTDSGSFFAKIEEVINAQLPEFAPYKRQIKYYLALYFNIDQT